MIQHGPTLLTCLCEEDQFRASRDNTFLGCCSYAGPTILLRALKALHRLCFINITLQSGKGAKHSQTSWPSTECNEQLSNLAKIRLISLPLLTPSKESAQQKASRHCLCLMPLQTIFGQSWLSTTHGSARAVIYIYTQRDIYMHLTRPNMPPNNETYFSTI